MSFRIRLAVSALIFLASPMNPLLGEQTRKMKDGEGPPTASIPLLVSSDAGFCGSAAVDFVAHRMGGPLADDEHYQTLRQLKYATLFDLRKCLEQNGFLVRSYSLAPGDVRAWDYLGRTIDQGTSEVIVLIPTLDPNTNEESGHYFVAQKVSKEGLLLIDPMSSNVLPLSFQNLISGGRPIAVQIVQSKEASQIHLPLSWQRALLWSALPLASILFIFGMALRHWNYGKKVLS